MNRRDLLIFCGVILWAYYLIVVLPKESHTFSGDIIRHFAMSMVLIVLYIIFIIVTSLLIHRFGKWGDKKIFGKQ